MKALFIQHLAALQTALRRLKETPLGTLLSLLVIALALALPSAGWLTLDNLSNIAGTTSGIQEISIFMTLEANEKDVAHIESLLKESNPGKWRFTGKDEALKNLQTKAGMADIMTGLSTNPLPDAFVVESADTTPARLEALAATFSAWPQVAHVQLDSSWIKRIDTFLRIGKLTTMLLAALFAITLIVVTFNTIRLQILAQTAEIEVIRLIGATDAFIRRPFQYYGALQGLLGGLMAAMLVTAGGNLLSVPVGELIHLYGSQFTPHGLSPLHVVLLTGTGGILGWLGAQLSVTIHLFSTR